MLNYVVSHNLIHRKVSYIFQKTFKYHPHYIHIFTLFSDCCSHVLAYYLEDDTNVYHTYPEIFNAFVREKGTVHGKDHYTSLDGTMALAFTDCGAWGIQNDEKR